MCFRIYKLYHMFICGIHICERDKERGRLVCIVSGTGFTDFPGKPSLNNHNCPLLWVLFLFHLQMKELVLTKQLSKITLFQ